MKKYTSFTIKYISALLLLSLLSIFAYINLDTLINLQSNDSQIINLSGKQRMLSQRIYNSVSSSKMENLKISIELMESSHQYLISLPKSKEMVEMFFNKPTQLDKRIKEYLSKAKKIKKNISDENSKYIKDQSDNLLKDFDKLTYMYQLESEKKIKKLKYVEQSILMASFFVLFLIGFFIFRPANRKFEKRAKEIMNEKNYQEELNKKLNEEIEKNIKKDEMLINQSRHAAMGEMIGMIAHQWRQPITVISMNANNMLVDIELENFSNTEAEKYANNINKQTEHLSQTIDDFRNFFKPDKVISEVNIKETIASTLSIVSESLKNNNIELTSSFETDKEVKAYPRELMQVFVNIINNSKDALISHKSENASITIRVYEDEKYINTEVCDNAGGIDEDVLPKVFDPYFSTKKEKNGTGLGLYISKMIIENHLNGTIEVYNNDEGACFTVKLLKNK